MINLLSETAKFFGFTFVLFGCYRFLVDKNVREHVHDLVEAVLEPLSR